MSTASTANCQKNVFVYPFICTLNHTRQIVPSQIVEFIGIQGLTVSLRDTKIVSEYDQEIPQSQTADNHMAPRGRAAQSSQDTRKTN